MFIHRFYNLFLKFVISQIVCFHNRTFIERNNFLFLTWIFLYWRMARMVAYCVLGIRSTSWFCDSISSSMYWILINSSISWLRSLSYICFLSSYSCRFCPYSSTCPRVICYATTFHLSSSNLLCCCSSFYFFYASYTLCFLLFYAAMTTLSIIGCSFILRLRFPPGLCKTFLFSFSYIRLHHFAGTASGVISFYGVACEVLAKLTSSRDFEVL